MKKIHYLRLFLSLFIIISLFSYFIFLNNDLKDFETVFEKTQNEKITLILDPGHGGEDGGAVSVTGKYESEINLEIVQKCEQLAAFYGFLPVLTRESNTINYPAEAVTIRERKVADQKQRVTLINSYEDAVLISVHQNKFTSSAPSGAQVFFSSAPGGEELAKNIQENFVNNIDPENRRTASKISDSIYLMKSAKCTAVLVECGFISNDKEAFLLENTQYQAKIAASIMGGLLNWYSAEEQI